MTEHFFLRAQPLSAETPSEAPRPPLLFATDVSKSFGETRALRGLDFAIYPGELVAVMGPSGSGKSTLLHCLAGILQPDSGAITYDAHRIDRLDDDARSRLRRTEFGFVFQFGQLVSELTAAENVAIPLMLSGVKRRQALRSAESWLATFDLEGLGHRRPGQLSGGQAQRVAVARAMITKPKIVFADEPTGSLDSAAGIAVLEVFTRAARAHSVSVVIVTHEPRVAAYADRAVVVRDGAIAPASAFLSDLQ